MTSQASSHSPENRILAALPEREYQTLFSKSQTVSLPDRHVLLEQGRPVRFVYFPVTAMISLLSVGGEGTRGVEVCTVGCEGVAGLSVFFDGDISLGRAVVQLSGTAVRVEANAFKDALRGNGVLNDILKRYTQVEVNSILRAAFCINFHKIDARLARLLLLTHNNARADTFPLTQEFAAQLLGSHRPAISIAANALQAARIISYRQGKITVLDRQGLHDAACECYSVVAGLYERLLGGLLAPKA
jgi:CRP-like cAMP-binding protein